LLREEEERESPSLREPLLVLLLRGCCGTRAIGGFPPPLKKSMILSQNDFFTGAFGVAVVLFCR
jgi:hypothetical protein